MDAQNILKIANSAVNKSLKMHRLSKLFQPVSVIPKDAQIKKQQITSNSQRLMIEMGIIKQANPGCYHFLPLGVKSLEKLTKVIDQAMEDIDGQKVIFPTLINRQLWETSGRINDAESELFQLKDRHRHSYILSPTHEEVAAELFGPSQPVSYKQLPLRLYQITNKFRDEMKPRFGLMRCRQFLMKDMYSFDVDHNASMETYEVVHDSYKKIFDKIGVPYVRVEGPCGNMGGTLSHEFHFISQLGEETIFTCKNCNYSVNFELLKESHCPQCQNNDLAVSQGIEVGHTFLLGEKYSKPLKAMYTSKEMKPKYLQMGSYGLGLSRIIAASIEVLSSEQQMKWPDVLVPYNVVILPPKRGSKEEKHTKVSIDELYSLLQNIPSLQNNILVDDRTSMTIGQRLLEANKFGYPFQIVIGKKSLEDPPLIELNDLKRSTQIHLSINELLNYVRENIMI